jgi:high-affinity Fe2+/Pb2+ permease
MANEIVNVLKNNLLDIIITIISLVVSYYIIPTIKNDLIPFLQEKRMLNIVKTFVEGVEKMTEAGIIEKCDKKDKVIQLLESKNIKVTPEIDVLIEACVKQLDIVADNVINEIKEQ